MSNVQAMTADELREYCAKLEANNTTLAARLASTAKANHSMKVTEKGGLSLYGLGRFPVTLYRSQWEKLLDKADAIREFITANADKLTVKEGA